MNACAKVISQDFGIEEKGCDVKEVDIIIEFRVY